MLSVTRLTLLLLMAVVVQPAAAAGQTRALLVGVSKYSSLEQRFQLQGPANDVRLYRDLLRARGVPAANVRVLADGVQGAARPTRAAVLQGLSDLASATKAGDFVFILVSGHGSQQPVGKSSGAEPDGRDEIFLPADVGRWDGEIRKVDNAVTDNELGAAIDRIRAQGAFVWAVFDTCHAGTMTREISAAGERERSVSPQALGVDEAAFATVLNSSRPSGTRGAPASDKGRLADVLSKQSKGDFVFMYASQSYESAQELPLPENTRGAKPYGQFSFTLYQVLVREPQVSYLQAVQRVMQIYLSKGHQSPSPLYEGSKLDAIVFGDTNRAVVTQWPLERVERTLQVRAGQIHGVTKGSILSVVATPTSAANAVLGYVQVADSAASTATVVPIAYEKRPALEIGKIPSAPYARPVDLKVDFQLRVGLPQPGKFCQQPQQQVTQAIDQLRKNTKYASRVIWADAKQSADVYLCQKGDNLLFLDPSREVRDGSGKSIPGIRVPVASAAAVTTLAAALESQLMRVSRVVNLARVIAGNSSMAGSFEVKLDVRQQCTANDRACDPKPRVLDTVSRETLREGDIVSISLTNRGNRPVDVTILYVDATYGIGHIYPKSDKDVPRLEPNSSHSFEFPMNASPSGFERMLVLAVPAAPQAPIVSFESLAQESIPTVRDARRRGARSEGDMLDLLEEAAFGSSPFSTTRGTPQRGVDVSAMSAVTYAWTVLPRQPK